MSGIAPAVSFLRGLTGIERHADGAIAGDSGADRFSEILTS